MRLLLALWLLTNACHGRFNAEAPSLIERMVAVGDESLQVKKINLSQLSSAHDYQDSAVVCIDLDMRGQKLMSKEVDILSSLTMKQQVRSIVLKSGPIDSEDLSMILQAVLWKSDVRCLSLHNCRLNSEALQSALDKNHNALSDKAVIGSEKHKKQKSSSIIQNNEAEQRLVNDKLILLDLSFNSFDNKSFKALSAMMKKCTKLQILSLDGNKMHVRDVQLLFECVRGHPSVTRISLSDCGLTDDCMDQISFALKMNRNICKLDLSSNKISSEGLCLLADGFRAGGGRRLETLDLSYNPIGDIGIQSLARAISSGNLLSLKNLTLKEVHATAVSLEKLLHSFSYDAVLESIDISGNDLMPTNKQKKIKTGYSPKNFKKKLLSYQPQFSNAMKSVSGILSSHMQTASEMFDTNSSKRKYSLKIDKITNEKSAKKGKGKLSARKMLGKKSSKKNSEITKRGMKKIENLPSINEKIKTKENEIKSKKSSLSTPMIKDMILSEDKMIEKLRMKVIWGLFHTLKVARNLKKIGLIKVGLNDFNCVLLRKEFDKREKEKNDEKKNEIDNIIQNKSNIEIKSKELKKQIEVKKLKKSNENYKSLSPQISIPSEPELITNLENLSFTKQDEKDLDSSIYHHLRYDDVGDKKEIQFSSTTIENESKNENENENNSFTSSIKQSRTREILITYSLNELSQKSFSDITEIVQYS